MRFARDLLHSKIIDAFILRLTDGCDNLVRMVHVIVPIHVRERRQLLQLFALRQRQLRVTALQQCVVHFVLVL